jgi:putative aldouronate transport system permease protein
MVLFMFTMYFSGGLIPTYLNFKDLGLLNTRAIMLISGGLSVYNMIIARTFFANTIPWEMHEAARIDGANDFQTFFKIVLPLSKPIVVVLILYYGVGHWNSYFAEMIYLSKARDLWPLQLILREILIKSTFAQNAIAEGSVSAEEMKYLLHQADIANMLKYCVIIVSTIPMLVIYPFIQKFFAKGIMIGSVKG